MSYLVIVALQLVAHYHNKTDGLLTKLTEPCVCKGYVKKERSMCLVLRLHSLLILVLITACLFFCENYCTFIVTLSQFWYCIRNSF